MMEYGFCNNINVLYGNTSLRGTGLNHLLKQIGLGYKVTMSMISLGKIYSPYERHYGNGNDMHIAWDYRNPTGEPLTPNRVWDRVHDILGYNNESDS